MVTTSAYEEQARQSTTDISSQILATAGTLTLQPPLYTSPCPSVPV